MTQNATLTGKKIYEMDLALTGVADFSVSMDAIITRKEAIPLQGAPPRSGEPTLDIFENLRLSTADKEYFSVNERRIWSVGTASLATGKTDVEAFMQ